MTEKEKEIWDIVSDNRIKVLKERNPDYEEILSLFEDFSKKVENVTTFETVVENIVIGCKGVIMVCATIVSILFAINCIAVCLK